MDVLLERLKATTSNFTATQLATIAGAFVLVVAIVAGSAWWLNKPDYALLFADMDAESAAQVITRLKSMKVRYQIDPGGGAIRVDPAERTIVLSGESTAYGAEPDRDETVALLKKAYPDYDVRKG